MPSLANSRIFSVPAARCYKPERGRSLPSDDIEQTEDGAIMAEQKKRDWVSLLAPSLVAVAFSLAINIGTTAWYFGSLNQRMNSAESEIKLLKATEATRQDLQDAQSVNSVYRQELDTRLDRMEDKMDRVIENQTGRRGIQ